MPKPTALNGARDQPCGKLNCEHVTRVRDERQLGRTGWAVAKQIFLATAFCCLLYRSGYATVRQRVLSPSLVAKHPEGAKLVHSGCGFEINFLPLAADDAGSDLRQRLTLLVLAVRVIKLFQANRTVRRMRALIACPQTFVSRVIAVAVAG
jgi:hypothetical protein